jgi:hypothetical protein
MDINGAIADFIVGVLEQMGDPHQLHPASGAFADQAANLRALQETLSRPAASGWDGDAAEANQSMLHFHAALVESAANELETAGQTMDDHTSKAWEIVREIIGLILEILELLAAGAALTWLGGLLADLIWARMAPLMQRILKLLTDFRTLLRQFTANMQRFGTVAGRIAEIAESVLVDYVPVYARAYPGFVIANAVPSLLSGRKFDWRTDAWQTAIFSGVDLTVNLFSGAFERTAVGVAFKKQATERLGRLFGNGRDESAGSGQLLRTSSETAPVLPALDLPPALDDEQLLELVDERIAARVSADSPTTAIAPARASETRDDAAVSLPSSPATVAQVEPVGPPASPVNPPQMWKSYTRMTQGEKMYDGMREGANTAIAVVGMDAIVGAIDGDHKSVGEYFFDFLGSGIGAGVGQTAFDHFGKELVYRGQKEGALMVERYLSQYPASISAYSVYMVIKDALRHAIINGTSVPTELNPEAADTSSTPKAS